MNLNTFMIILESLKQTKFAVILIIYLAFFLDNMLLTVVVPIIPDFLHTTSLKLIPKSAFYDNIENMWPVNSIDDKYQSKNLSSMINLHIAENAITTHKQKNSEEKMKKQEDEDLEKENGPVGILLSAKALVQLVLNPIVGIWTTKVGYSVPIFFGSVNLLIASLLFAYGESYMAMLCARAIQGVCSSCIGVSGMCLVAETFRGGSGDSGRAGAMSILLGGSALGVLVGYPVGGLLYEFVGKTAPFLLIGSMIFITIVLQLTFLDLSPTYEKSDSNAETIWMPILTDKVIIVTTGAIFISTSAMAILEPCLPIWLMTHIRPEKWQVGTVFIPDSMGYLLGTNLFGTIACKVGQWRVSVIALITIAVAAIVIPSAVSLSELMLPHFMMGLAIGALDAALVPLLATLVDSRHGACYGAVFSLQQTAVSLAYSVAPLVGGTLAREIGFSWTMRGLGLLNALYSPLLAAYAWKVTTKIQNSRLIDSDSSDCENINQAISLATYGTTFD